MVAAQIHDADEQPADGRNGPTGDGRVFGPDRQVRAENSRQVACGP